MVSAPFTAPSGPFDATIATSAHALPKGAAIPEPQRQKPFFAVGNRTEEAARAAGFTNLFRCDSHAADLAALVTSTLNRSARVLYLAGRHRKPTLEAALDEAGIFLTVHVAYEARGAKAWAAPVIEALGTGRVDAALHFSRRSATLALDLARRHQVLPAFLQLRHYCLSPDVSVPLCGSGAATIEVAPRPDAASLLALLTAVPKAQP